MDGFADPQKPVSVPIFTPTIAILTGTDTPFFTKMQKIGYNLSCLIVIGTVENI